MERSKYTPTPPGYVAIATAHLTELVAPEDLELLRRAFKARLQARRIEEDPTLYPEEEQWEDFLQAAADARASLALEGLAGRGLVVPLVTTQGLKVACREVDLPLVAQELAPAQVDVDPGCDCPTCRLDAWDAPEDEPDPEEGAAQEPEATPGEGPKPSLSHDPWHAVRGQWFMVSWDGDCLSLDEEFSVAQTVAHRLDPDTGVARDPEVESYLLDQARSVARARKFHEYQDTLLRRRVLTTFFTPGRSGEVVPRAVIKRSELAALEALVAQEMPGARVKVRELDDFLCPPPEEGKRPEEEDRLARFLRQVFGG
jgi:hypothetical protein